MQGGEWPGTRAWGPALASNTNTTIYNNTNTITNAYTNTTLFEIQSRCFKYERQCWRSLLENKVKLLLLKFAEIVLNYVSDL